MRAFMENSPKYRDDAQNLLPSPPSCNISNNNIPTRPVTTISGSTSSYPTTFVQTDISSFKQVVQMLTGCSKKPNYPNPTHQPDSRSSSRSIPPIKAVPNKKQSSSSSSFRLYERRNYVKHLKINPVFNPIHPGLPDIISPSILDFPSLVLSPVTPLTSDPFDRSGSSNQSPNVHGFGHYDPKPSSDAEEQAIKEKGFYLHPSPSRTPGDPEPRLLPLFPVTSPRNSDSVVASTS